MMNLLQFVHRINLPIILKLFLECPTASKNVNTTFMNVFQNYQIIIYFLSNNLLIINNQYMNRVKWAFDHSDTKLDKYSERHAYFAFLYSLVLFMGSLYFAAKYIPNHIHIDYHPYIAIFLTLYLFIMIGSRVIENGLVALYEVSWACNLCMLEVIYGLITKDGRLLQAAFITVSVDQILWYVDIAGYAVLKKFPVGVAKYLIWPQTSNLRRFTSTHHLWFIPLIQYVLGKRVLSYESLNMALLNIVILMIIGRTTAPRQVTLKNGRHVYMNINLSWELWKDVKIRFLQVFAKQPFYIYLPSLFVVWGGMSYIFFQIIRTVQMAVIKLL